MSDSRPSERASLKEVYRLYTNDFRREELGRLPEETREAYRLFTSELDRRQWSEMRPVDRAMAILRSFFLGLTLRMSPLRRFLYLLALLSFVGGLLGSLLYLWISFGLLNFVLILEIADKLTLKGDLQIAKEIQTGLLPSGTFQLGNRVEVHARSTPANTVGGDYFDFLKLPQDWVGIAVGDVSGKGIPAALLMAYLQASFRALSSVPEFSMTRLMERVNDHIFRNTPSNRLITFFFCALDETVNSLSFCNAGHNPPILFHGDGSCQRLEEGGLPLGIREGAAYPCGTVPVRPGDTLLLYTDGITEAANSRGEEYGERRLQHVVADRVGERPEQLANAVMSSVMQFVGNSRYRDDLTLVIVRF